MKLTNLLEYNFSGRVGGILQLILLILTVLVMAMALLTLAITFTLSMIGTVGSFVPLVFFIVTIYFWFLINRIIGEDYYEKIQEPLSERGKKKLSEISIYLKKYFPNYTLEIYEDKCINGYVTLSKRSTVHITAHTLNHLKLKEIKSLICHEIGHLIEGDNKLSIFILRRTIYYGLGEYLFNLYSRYRELIADSYSIRLGGISAYRSYYRVMGNCSSNQNEPQHLFKRILSTGNSTHPSYLTRSKFTGKITLKHVLTLFV